MSHNFRKDCSLYEHRPRSKFDMSPHFSDTSGTSTSSSQSFGSSFSKQQSKMDSNQVSLGSSGSRCFAGSSSEFGGDFGERMSSHQNRGFSFSCGFSLRKGCGSGGLRRFRAGKCGKAETKEDNKLHCVGTALSDLLRGGHIRMMVGLPTYIAIGKAI